MLKDQLRKLFTSQDPSIQAVIYEVLTLEQEYISMERPRLKEQIDDIINRAANKELGLTEKKRTSE